MPQHCPHCHYPLFSHEFQPSSSLTQELNSHCEFIKPYIMLVKHIPINYSHLIKRLESVLAWKNAAVSSDLGSEYQEHRNNDTLLICGASHKELQDDENNLTQVFHATANIYLNTHQHLQLKSDLGFEVLRYKKGQKFDEHVDSLPGTGNIYGQRQLSSLLYLNDNYQGGEIYFPQQELLYNPEAGDLLIFPSNFCFPHCSTEIKQGTKYAIVSWYI